MEELRPQQVFATLAQEFGTKEAGKTFSHVFFEGTPTFENQKIIKARCIGTLQGFVGTTPSDDAGGQRCCLLVELTIKDRAGTRGGSFEVEGYHL